MAMVTVLRTLRIAVGLALSVVLVGQIWAQQSPKLPRIGLLTPGDVERYNKALIEGLREHGYVNGVTAIIDDKRTGGDFDSGAKLAEELVAVNPDVIFSVPGALAKHVVRAVDRSDKKTPIVVYTDDPVEEGLVASAAHPGGNVTGIGDIQDPELVTKLLQMLKEMAPSISRVMYLEDLTWGPGTFRAQRSREAIENAGREMRIQVVAVQIRNPEDIERAFSQAARQRLQGIVVIASPLVVTHRGRIISLAARHRLPAIYGDELFAYDGGLVSYWTSIADMHILAANLIAKILRGAKPGDLPVEYPTRFRLVVNLKTAKALGLTVPKSVLLQADEVIKKSNR